MTLPDSVTRSTAPEHRRRTFRDTARITWEVSEVRAPPVPSAPRSTCLVFQCSSQARRVYDFPAEWWTLSESELESLSWRT